MKIISLNIGQLEQLTDYHHKPFQSAIRKKPTKKEIHLSNTGFTDDECYEDCHGGHNMAVHMYCHDNYAFFNEKAGYEIPMPAFGENITIADYDEHQCHVGDVLQIGEAILQVSQPTERCRIIGMSLGLPKMLKWIHEKMMTGFYLRVLQPGKLSVNSEVSLIEQGPKELNIANLNHLLFKQLNKEKFNCILQYDVLSDEWKKRAKVLYAKAEKQ